MHNYIYCEIRGELGVITLNSEKTLNALSVPMIDECLGVLNEWKRDEKIKCIFLQGAGGKAFCAGGDVRQVRTAVIEYGATSKGAIGDHVTGAAIGDHATGAAIGDHATGAAIGDHATGAAIGDHATGAAIADHATAASVQSPCGTQEVAPYCLEFFTKEYQLDYAIHRYPKPVVVWADGIVMGGGIGLAAGASHRVVTERSKFAMPEITIGLYPDVGGTWFLNQLPDGYGLYLGMTGTRLTGDDCLYLGLADVLLSSSAKAELLERLTSANWQSSNDANAEVATAILLDIGAKNASSNSAIAARATFVSGFQNTYSAEEFSAMLLAAKGKDEWIDAGIRSFEAGSPSSAHVIFEQLRRGKNLSLEDVFRSELNLSVQCSLHPDFAEGVRALLVDKDHSPKWHPATLDDVTKAWVESYFAPLWTADSHPLKHLGSTEVGEVSEVLCQQ